MNKLDAIKAALKLEFSGRCPAGPTHNGAGYARALDMLPAVLGTGPAPERGDPADLCDSAVRVLAVLPEAEDTPRLAELRRSLRFDGQRNVHTAMRLIGISPGWSRIGEYRRAA